MAPHITADTLSKAWVESARVLLESADHHAMHMIVHITDPTGEDPEIRRAVDDLMVVYKYQSVETIANTIFPRAIAATSRDYLHLAQRYEAMYETLRKRWRRNVYGTYFGRIVAYPTPSGNVDQLASLIEHLKIESKTHNPKTARFETTFVVPDGDGLPDDEFSESLGVFAPGPDRNRAMAFPCLSHCSFQLDRDRRVHALAHYRSQYLLQRAYGNYLGLGRLLDYVATSAGLITGELTVVAGHIRLENGIKSVRHLVAQSTSSK
jgi:thymidylate synthase